MYLSIKKDFSFVDVTVGICCIKSCINHVSTETWNQPVQVLADNHFTLYRIVECFLSNKIMELHVCNILQITLFLYLISWYIILNMFVLCLFQPESVDLYKTIPDQDQTRRTKGTNSFTIKLLCWRAAAHAIVFWDGSLNSSVYFSFIVEGETIEIQ